jgi:hypothetical protein
MNDRVSIDYQIARGGPLTSTIGPARQTITGTIDTAVYALAPNKVVLPIHMHIFARPDGSNSYTAFPSLSPNSSNAKAVAEWLAHVITDFRLVDLQDIGGVNASGLDWQSFQSAKLNATPLGNVQAVGDAIFGRCDVLTRAESVNIIRQDEGMESAIDSDFDCVERECGQDSGQHLFQDEFGNFQLTIGKYIQTAFASLELLGATLPQGVHLFFTGEIPNMDGVVVGCGCKSTNRGAGYALVQAGTIHPGETTVLERGAAHEIAHILGIRHVPSDSGDEEIEVFENTFFNRAPFPATAEHEEWCERVRTNARGAGFGG